MWVCVGICVCVWGHQKSVHTCPPLFRQLYVTKNLGSTWIWISDYVNQSFNYQWYVPHNIWTLLSKLKLVLSSLVCRADPRFDPDDSTIFYNVYNPNDTNRESSLWVASYPGRSNNKKKKTAWYPLFAHVRPSPEKPGDPV